MGNKRLEMKDCHEEEIQEEVILVNPIENESLEDITEHADTKLMAREIITPSSHKAAVLKYFGFQKESGNSGKLVIENKVTCKLCVAKVARSGGTTNLQNHLRSHHREEYNSVIGDSVQVTVTRQRLAISASMARQLQSYRLIPNEPKS